MKSIIQRRHQKKRRVPKNGEAAFFGITAEPIIEKPWMSIY
jgi:hypothetical protein